jgi:hypothetical protein
MTIQSMSTAANSVQSFAHGCYSFLYYSKMFNGNVKTSAQAVTCPKSAEDVSK